MIQESGTEMLYCVHQTLQTEPNATQRDIAKAIGMSLGMTNTLLKRFVDRGWLVMRRMNFQKVQYVFTAEGIKEVSGRTYRYMRRTVKLVYDYKDTIAKSIAAVKTAGIEHVVLIEDDDIAFLIEQACKECRITFSRADTMPAAKSQQTLYVTKNSTSELEPYRTTVESLLTGTVALLCKQEEI